MKARIFILISVSLFLSACSSQTAPSVAVKTTPGERSTTKDLHVDMKVREELGITVVEAVESSAGVQVSATGQLQINEDASWTVGAITDGKIISVPARVGDPIREGQVLAVLHSHDVHDARATYRQALAAIAREKVLAEQARTVRDRTQRLFELRAASREQLEAAEALFRSATSAVAALQADVDKAKFHLTDFLEVPAEAGDDHGGATEGLRIKSPAAGTVMERRASVGTVVSAGDPVFTVADLSSLWLIASVNEADMSRIHPGQRVQIAVRAFTDRTFTGRVLQLGERLDPQTRTLQVRVLVPNGRGLLKPEMFATAQFEIAGGPLALQVPEAAVQQVNGRTIVFVKNASESFSPREVSVGARSAGFVRILSGLKPGEFVVVNGAYLLKSQMLKESGD